MAPTPAPADPQPHRTPKGPEDHLQALSELANASSPDPTQLFDHGLSFLVHHLGVDRAFICRATDLGMEVFWWATATGEAPDLAVQELANHFCPLVLQQPEGTLAIHDAQQGEEWRALQASGARACLGVALSRAGTVSGVLSVMSRQPKAFRKAEVALVRAVAGLFGKTLELEQLKYDLHRTQEALDLTRAVMEDGLLESPVSRLPNLLHMDVWMRGALPFARRRGETIALVRWKLPPGAASLAQLREAMKGLRGEDLLVDLGKEEYLLLLPNTTPEGVEALLGKLGLAADLVPMGATVWDPSHRADGHDHALRHALRRTKAALAKSREAAREGATRLAWDLLAMGPDDLPEAADHRALGLPGRR